MEEIDIMDDVKHVVSTLEDMIPITYRVSHKKVYPFEANLVIIEFKSLAYVSHTIG